MLLVFKYIDCMPNITFKAFVGNFEAKLANLKQCLTIAIATQQFGNPQCINSSSITILNYLSKASFIPHKTTH